MAGDWVAAVRAWRELNAPLRADGAPDPVEEYTILQTLVATWPIEPERLCAYMEKAMREAKRNTTWIAPDAAWEERVLGYCRALYDHAPFRAAFEPFAARAAAAGERHALRQTALKLTVPGVPDLYQGDELVSLSLVDPDNRRPVDWARRRALLAARRRARLARRAQAAPDPRPAGAARAPAGRLRGRATRRSTPARTPSRSCAATPWPSRCRCWARSTRRARSCPRATGGR